MVKLAVTDLFPFIVTLTELLAPLAFPLQLEKVYPVFEVAVREITVSEVYCVPLLQLGAGLALIVPPALGLAFLVRV